MSAQREQFPNIAAWMLEQTMHWAPMSASRIRWSSSVYTRRLLRARRSSITLSQVGCVPRHRPGEVASGGVPKLHLTREAIRRLEIPAYAEGHKTRQALYFDELQPGLAVRVTSGGARVYVAQGNSNGETIRVKLGPVSALTLTQARQRAREVLGTIASGVNPNAQRKLARARAITLAESVEAYIETRKGARRLAPRTEYDYRRLLYGALKPDGTRKFNGYLSPWRARPLFSITEDMIVRRHAELAERSGAQANYAMRLLSAVFNFQRARLRVGDAVPRNPVEILRHLKAWVRIERRRTRLKAHELAPWFKAVLELSTEATADLADTARIYFQVLMLSGHRPGELARLPIADVDLKARTFTVRATKNRRDHTLPMSDYLHELFAAWLPEAKKRGNGEWVFPGAGPRGHIVEPKKLVAKVRERSGLAWTPADLRRTFISIAESLDIPAYALKGSAQSQDGKRCDCRLHHHGRGAPARADAKGNGFHSCAPPA
jgi:integrase